MVLSLLLVILPASCTAQRTDPAAADRRFASLRAEMVREQIANRGITDPDVLHALEKVPRHLFVPPEVMDFAYRDSPLPIGEGQTISQPYIVALMTELVRPRKDHRVLEVGTGSGYQAAVLAELVDSVFSVEIVRPLAAQASERLSRLGYRNVVVRAGDGYNGWLEHAPYDAILVTAAAEHVPGPLIDQLRNGGRLVIPAGDPGGDQELLLLEKHGGRITTRSVLPVRFVPLTREH
jgi:protein-L-isoaspartate(D-aspartate) O-methyltransferase